MIGGIGRARSANRERARLFSIDLNSGCDDVDCVQAAQARDE